MYILILLLALKWILLGLGSRNASGNGTDTSNSNSKRSSASIPPTPRSEGEILQSSNLRSYTFSELRAATRNFRPDSVVGEGGFGSVFKGWVDEHTLAASKPGTGIVIAVKKLNQEGWQGHREWLVSRSFVLLGVSVKSLFRGLICTICSLKHIYYWTLLDNLICEFGKRTYLINEIVMNRMT